MSIVTRQGDRGKTKLYSGEEVSKADRRMEAYGTLDELVSYLGLARSFCNDSEIDGDILKQQETLFRLGTELATKNASEVRHTPIKKSDVQEIDDLILNYEARVDLPKKFVVPGANRTSAFLDVARTVCRRFERIIVSLFDNGEWNGENALVFTNRLSDLLFLMARKAENNG